MIVPEHLTITAKTGVFDAIAAGPEDGRPVLLLHGFPEAGMAWEHQVSVLGQLGYRAIAPDQRGYSPATRTTNVSDYRVDAFVTDARSICESLEWDRFDLVGHDFGATVSWHLAADFPSQVRTLTAVSTPHPAALLAALQTDEDQHLRSGYLMEWRQRNIEQKMLENDAQGFRGIFDWRIPPSRIEEYLQRLTEPGALTAALNWYRANRPGGKVDPITVPTMYVWSTEDAAVGSTAAFDTENWVSGPYQFQMLEDVSHWVPEEAASVLSSLLFEHLEGH